MKFGTLIALLGLTFSVQSLAGTTADAISNEKPTAEQMKQGMKDFETYCATCHGRNGEGLKNLGKKLVGNAIVTGPITGNINMVLTGLPHKGMPSWGDTQISDQTFADVITYVRNAWGNDNRKVHGRYAGGLVTPAMIKKHRQYLDRGAEMVKLDLE